MSVRKRGGVYHFWFMVAGRRYYGCFNGKDGLPFVTTKREATDEVSVLRRKVLDGTYGQATGLGDFAGFVEHEYMRYARENKSSWRHDEFRCRMLKEHFAGKRLRDITPMLVERFIKDRLSGITQRKRQRSPTTVHKELVLLSAIFSMAVTQKLVRENPCAGVRKGVRKQLVARRKRDRFLNQYSPDEEERLLAQLTGRREHLHALVRFALETGLRRGEILRLRREHVNLGSSVWHRTVGGRDIDVRPGELLVEESKNKKPRTVPLSPVAREVVERQLADVTTGDYVFSSIRTGRSITEFKRAFSSAVLDAGIKHITFHDLRHTFATRLAAAGVHPVVIRDLLGHSGLHGLGMTGDYTHSTTEGREGAIAAISPPRPPLASELRQAG